MPIKRLWRRYRDAVLERDGKTDNIPDRTVFINLVNHFTRTERKRKSCVEYVLTALVYDNVANISHIVEGEVQSGAEKRKFLAKLSGIE